MPRGKKPKRQPILNKTDLFDCFDGFIKTQLSLKLAKKDEPEPYICTPDHETSIAKYISFAETEIYLLSIQRAELRLKLENVRNKLKTLKYSINNTISTNELYTELISRFEPKIDAFKHLLSSYRYIK